MNALKTLKTPLLISGALHVLFALLLLINWGSEKTEKEQVVVPQHVKASVVTDDPLKYKKQQNMAEKRKQWEAERKRKADQERKRALAEKKKIEDKKRKEAERKKKLADQKRKDAAKKKAAEEKKKQEALALKKKEQAQKKKEAEDKRLAEEKKKADELKRKQEEERKAKEELRKQEEELARLELERKEKEQEEQELKELELLEQELAELERQASERKKNQESQNNMIIQISAIIKESVNANWELPPGYDSQWNVVLRLYFQPDGDLRKVETVRSSGNVGFDRSAEQAAWRMGTIPEIRDLDEATFKKIQRIKLEFAPESGE
ncbi:cell envelope integrity protein TolA [Litoribacillus peritrichatus]|uniref:Cell envelope integrity protein TolA n=1 Tax=Litoribacillus peritrichatus TaxID=718191 RepID=A0ABP7N819_9GAMM